MSYQDHVGKAYEPYSRQIDARQVADFAAAIGDGNPIYRDEEAAKKAGYKGIPVPPTFPFTIEMDAGQAFNVLHDIGAPITRSVHGEQGFTYHRPIYAGDTITGQLRIGDIVEKGGGRLVLVHTESRLENQDGEHVADLRSVIIIRAK